MKIKLLIRSEQLLNILAARGPDGLALFLINASIKETVRVYGLPDGEYEWLVYHRQNTHPAGQSLTVINGRLEVELEGFSVSLLAQK